MIGFATDSVAPEHRFDHWREMRAKHIFGVTIELPAERRRAFQGRFRARSVGTATISSLRASAYTVRRTEGDIARMAGNSLCIAQQTVGPGRLETPHCDAGYVAAGDMTVSFSDIPFTATPAGDTAFYSRMAKIPISSDLLLGARVDALHAAKPDPACRALWPMQVLFNALSAGDIGEDEEGAMIDMARLALVTRGQLSIRGPEVRQAIRRGLLHGAIRRMEAGKQETGLTANSVAAELGISRRQLFLILEEAGMSFAKKLSDMRIRAARKLLLEQPELPVTRIAFECGFESLATFYRVFNATFSMAPGELRVSEQAPFR